jgi:hypothetical protein
MFEPPIRRAAVRRWLTRLPAIRGIGLPKVAHLLARFPDCEFAIHRLYARDAAVRAICDDYEEAVTALRHWESADPTDAAKAEDYRQLADEIEAEIVAILDGARAGRRPPGE